MGFTPSHFMEAWVFRPPATATYTHLDTAFSSDSFGYSATDPQGLQSSATVSITIASGNVFASAPEASPSEPSSLRSARRRAGPS